MCVLVVFSQEKTTSTHIFLYTLVSKLSVALFRSAHIAGYAGQAYRLN
jgi:hypothetical protein